MNVMIVGGGRVGSHLATLLIELGHQVRLVETSSEIIAKLHREIPTEAIYEGDPLDPQVLRNAGIEKTQVIVTCTSDDATNLAVGYLAKTEFGVPRVIGRVNNPRYAWLFEPVMGIDVALNQADVLARLIEEEMSLGDMMPLLKLRRGEYMLVEEKVPHGAQALGIQIKDLGLPENCVLAAIFRSGEVIVPRGVTALQAEDEVLAVVNRSAADQLAAIFKPSSLPASGMNNAGEIEGKDSSNPI